MTPTQRKAMEQALEALWTSANPNAEAAISAITAALAEQPAEQEPVYAFRRKGQDDFCTCDEKRYLELSDKPNLFETRIFYTAPQPAKRVPLTDEELRDALRICPHDTVENLRVRWLYAKDFARAVIAAYDAKNGITGETK